MYRFVRMGADSAARRLKVLTGILQSGPGTRRARFMCTSSGEKVTIGDVSISVKIPKNPELVPTKYVPEVLPQSVMRHLRWIMQKDLLGQDVFLIGPPGPLRRTLAMMYLELTKREAEYVSLSRDTTETDLKQRREITGGTAYHMDQCAVRAATEGRILILEGIEKAERNVLPVLNNLLENREMQLDDGRFLVAGERYDKLLKEHTQEELDAWKLVRVDNRFRVIALGLPVPRYQGNPLDPPLRSRFQARDINPLPFKHKLEILNEVGGNVASERISQLLSFATTMHTTEASALGLPDFPMDNLPLIVSILNLMPSSSTYRLLHRLYPYDVMMAKEGQTSVEDTLKKFELLENGNHVTGRVIGSQRDNGMAAVDIQCNGTSYSIKVPAGTGPSTAGDKDFIMTPHHDTLLADMVQSHMVKDFCIIGPKGCGKSVLTKQFADMLGYHVEPIMLYQDMTSRDLLQQRTTNSKGDTIWRPSPLVSAALEGSLAVLDGVHRINAGTFAVLHRLIHDREVSLFDGSRLLRRDRYDSIKESTGYSDEELAARNIFPIHPSFRVIGLAEPPVVGSSGQQWLSSELLTTFLFHHMRPLSRQEETNVITKMVPETVSLGPLLDLTHALRQSSDSTVQSIASSLSTRQLLRIARRQAQYPGESLYDTVQKACLARFLPRLAKASLERSLEDAGITKTEKKHSVDSIDEAITCEVKDGHLRVGSTRVPVFNPETRMKVPDILFYENPQHLSVMEDMLKDFMLGEHLLLVGNQGVGKNKIVDRFLQLLNRPREYLQLHRDTTVQTLTLQPTVQEGVIVYEDSPLVRAVKMGNVLVVDEADKAPTHVTCILKTLVESGEMHLADGRRIVSAHSGIPASSDVIVMHTNFRMIVLANRPGFPFLGNDFFGAMGDIFSAHAVDNPNMESEMAMLRQYGPGVPEAILKRLVLAFGELRDMADQGLIAYPYSTREVVNMVRHLEKFPDEGLAMVVRNVFDFDTYNKEMEEVVINTLHKHGIPVGAGPNNINLAKEFPMPKFAPAGRWSVQGRGQRKRSGVISLPVEIKPLRIKGPVNMYIDSNSMEKTEARSMMFSEMESYWTLPLRENAIVTDVAVTKAQHRSPGHQSEDLIHITTANPITLYTMKPGGQHVTSIDLYDVFPSNRHWFRPRVKIATLGAPMDDSVILHEEQTNVILNINFETGELRRLETSSLLETAADGIVKFYQRKAGEQDIHRMCKDFAHEPEGLLVFYKVNGQTLEVLNNLEGTSHTIEVPLKIQDVHMASKQSWLLTEANTNRRYMLLQTAPMEYTLNMISEDGEGVEGKVDLVTGTPLSDALLSKALKEKIASPNRVLLTPNTYASIAVGMPDLETSELYKAPRDGFPEENASRKNDPLYGLVSRPATPNVQSAVAYMPETGMVIRALPTWKVPKNVFPNQVAPSGINSYLEVADIANHNLRYIPVPGGKGGSPYTTWFQSISDCNLLMAPLTNDRLVTVDSAGCVRLWETAMMHIMRSIQEWRNMIGRDENEPLQMSIEKETEGELGGPKHGKMDPDNTPHSGGNTWAGGTGGRDTAGMGGIGGPYRLDAGHEVTQVPQWQKDSVPEHIKKAAREMGLKAWKERLREINMSEYDADLYDSYSKGVKRQISSLRVILDSLQAKGKERQWLKHQTYGELDDAKLIEGLTGERAIYKRRGEQEPEMGSPQQKPKRLKIIVDVSGSMYRFNGHDSRLEREMEAALMVMEAFEGYEHKFKYDIMGHSGEMYNAEFVHQDKPPKNNKERLAVLKTMIAHSQFCISGDNTLAATKHGINALAKEEADEYFVIMLSDANLDVYGIPPERLGNILTMDEKVNAYAIFIGSLGNQAQNVVRRLPSGHGFVCMDTKNLPQILQQIFTSTMLSS